MLATSGKSYSQVITSLNTCALHDLCTLSGSCVFFVFFLFYVLYVLIYIYALCIYVPMEMEIVNNK